MQTLQTYLKGRKKVDFATLINVSAAQLSQYLSGYRRPSYDLMLLIQEKTGGEVTVQSWANIGDHPPSHVSARTPTQAPGDKRRAG
mgnify:CR=1 FL=1